MHKRLLELLTRTFEYRSHDADEFEFYSSAEISPSESCMHIGARTIIASPAHIGACGFWIHEFTELTIIGIFYRWGKNWQTTVEFEGFKRASIPHFISPFGKNNGRCLIPLLSRKYPKW